MYFECSKNVLIITCKHLLLLNSVLTNISSTYLKAAQNFFAKGTLNVILSYALCLKCEIVADSQRLPLNL